MGRYSPQVSLLCITKLVNAVIALTNFVIRNNNIYIAIL